VEGDCAAVEAHEWDLRVACRMKFYSMTFKGKSCRYITVFAFTAMISKPGSGAATFA